ncbi:Inosine-5'-monophosphate dehydrogenase [Arenibacter antarcticus]|uniref:CBS domain-containing protein n=1 Tax=Arenibacter antarcticus TaxID=2040469 RepID=A0ABW5VFI8_9FLAO|nr:CBS domain-containing protein [Arenibacter sp. H213]MCM4169492.1 acetoin utilization protein acuB [Arenibacter sp. H213]
MHIQDSILTTLPVFKVTDSLKKVIQFFEQATYSHVAVVDNEVYLGVLEKNDLDTFEEDKQIEDYRYQLATFFARPEASWLDVLEAFSKNDANILPVVEDSGKVVGYYDLIDVVNLFIETPFFTEPGGILVLAKGIKDYSFSEIAQIVESNNLKLIGAFITDSRNDVIQITIKIGATHLNEVIQSFRRYNYTILYGNDDDQFLEDLKQRSDYLDKYLNV